MNETMDATLAALKAKLDETVAWPSVYVFKFIVTRAELPKLEELFSGKPFSLRDSKKGNYVCLTAELAMESSAQVVAIYRQAKQIKGIIAL